MCSTLSSKRIVARFVPLSAENSRELYLYTITAALGARKSCKSNTPRPKKAVWFVLSSSTKEKEIQEAGRTSRPARSATKLSILPSLDTFAMKVPPVAVYLKCRLCNPGPAVVSFTCSREKTKRRD